MFTGIVEQHSRVLANDLEAGGRRLMIASPFDGLAIGESIAVNGVCLTLISDTAGELIFNLSPETLTITTLGQLVAGDSVNLERAMLAQTRFGGHYVSGHVDTKAYLQSVKAVGEFLEVVVSDFMVAADLYLLPKGSITLDGVSLTINRVSDNTIVLMLVPHTLKTTTLGSLSAGHQFNVEFDYLTRIVAHQLSISGQLKNEVYSR